MPGSNLMDAYGIQLIYFMQFLLNFATYANILVLLSYTCNDYLVTDFYSTISMLYIEKPVSPTYTVRVLQCGTHTTYWESIFKQND